MDSGDRDDPHIPHIRSSGWQWGDDISGGRRTRVEMIGLELDKARVVVCCKRDIKVYIIE